MLGNPDSDAIDNHPRPSPVREEPLVILRRQEVTVTFSRRDKRKEDIAVKQKAPVLPVSGRGSTGRAAAAAVCSILLMLQCSLALNSAETTELHAHAHTHTRM